MSSENDAATIKNVQDIDRDFSSGSARKAMALNTINTICNFEDFLLPAPASVAILGQLMAIATTIDFSIANNEPIGGFQYVRYPDSFRACLVQISTSGCDAFTNAHTNMDQIRLYTMQFQANIKDLVKIILKGSQEDKNEIAPKFLKDIQKQANKCLQLAKSTHSDFSDLTKLLEEILCAATAAKGVHEKQLAKTIHQSRILKHRQELVEHQQAEIQKEKDEIIEKISAAKAAIEKSENEMPGPFKMLLMNTYDQALKVVSTCANVFAISKLATPVGIAAVVVKGVVDLGKHVSNKYDVGSQKEDDSKALTIALKYAPDIYVLTKYLQEKIETQSSQISTEEDESEKKNKEVQQHAAPSKQTIEHSDIVWIRERLGSVEKELKSSDVVSNKYVQSTLHLCKQIINICSRTKQATGSDGILWKCLLTEINSILKEAETLKTMADQYFSPGSVLRVNHSVDSSSKRKGLTQQVTDSVMYKIESRKQELEYMRVKQEGVKEKAKEIEQNQSKILEDLLKTDLQKINFDEIIDTFSKGMRALGEIDEQWRMLVLFFSLIVSHIDICLHQPTDKFIDLTHGTGHRLNAFNSQIFLETAASINAVAYSVGLVAETYTDISAKHLVQTTAGLVKMIALHPERDKEELNFRRRELNENCAIAQHRIRQLAAERREKALNHVHEQFAKITILESKLPAIEEERKKKISEDVAKSVEVMCIDDQDEGDYI